MEEEGRGLWERTGRDAHPEERTLGCHTQLGSLVQLLFISWTKTKRTEKAYFKNN